MILSSLHFLQGSNKNHPHTRPRHLGNPCCLARFSRERLFWGSCLTTPWVKGLDFLKGRGWWGHTWRNIPQLLFSAQVTIPLVSHKTAIRKGNQPNPEGLTMILQVFTPSTNQTLTSEKGGLPRNFHKGCLHLVKPFWFRCLNNLECAQDVPREGDAVALCVLDCPQPHELWQLPGSEGQTPWGRRPDCTSSLRRERSVHGPVVPLSGFGACGDMVGAAIWGWAVESIAPISLVKVEPCSVGDSPQQWRVWCSSCPAARSMDWKARTYDWSGLWMASHENWHVPSKIEVGRKQLIPFDMVPFLGTLCCCCCCCCCRCRLGCHHLEDMGGFIYYQTPGAKSSDTRPKDHETKV